jgi:diguanylate cyclase (GGDEF)-like protein
VKETVVNHIAYLFFSFTKQGEIIDCNLTFIHLFGHVQNLRKLLDESSIDNCFKKDKRENFHEISFLNGDTATLINIDRVKEERDEIYYLTAKYNVEKIDFDCSFPTFNQLDILNYFPFVLFELNDEFVITHIQGRVKDILGINTEDLLIFSDVVDGPSYGKLQMLFNELDSSENKETIESEMTLKIKPESYHIYLRKKCTTYMLVMSPFPKGYLSIAETMMGQYSSMTQLNTELMKKNQTIVKQKEEFEKLSRTDSLTGLFNRRHFHYVITKEHQRSKELDYQISLLMIDLNHFKQVNDIYGHHVGDQLLKKFADIARNQTREERDYTFRFGGDEFLIILTECNEDGALKIAKRIERLFKELTNNSLSYGVVSLPKNTELNVDKYLKIVDKRMYINKKESHENAGI